MKKATLFIIPCFVIFVTMISCTASYEDYRSTPQEIISQGQWSVDYYYQGQDMTAQYTNAQFLFKSNGVLICRQNGVDIDGNWSSIKDINRNDILIIKLNTQNTALLQLSQEWNVAGLSLKLVDMKDKNNAEWRIKQL